MLDKLSAGTEELVADFGPYQLVIRPFDGAYGAVLWHPAVGTKPAEKLMSVRASTFDEAHALLGAQFYAARLKDDHTSHDVGKYTAAWSYLWGKLTDKQRKMIRAQYRAPARTVTTLQLAAAVGWSSHSSVNLWYDLAGFALFGEVPIAIEMHERGSPVYSFAISTGCRLQNDPRSVWAWTMRPEVADGLLAAGCVGPGRR